MNELGVFYGSDLKRFDMGTLKNNFGKSGEHFLKLLEVFKIIQLIQIECANP